MVDLSFCAPVRCGARAATPGAPLPRREAGALARIRMPRRQAPIASICGHAVRSRSWSLLDRLMIRRCAGWASWPRFAPGGAVRGAWPGFGTARAGRGRNSAGWQRSQQTARLRVSPSAPK